jgi:excisionase family DNA binding protein
MVKSSRQNWDPVKLLRRFFRLTLQQRQLEFLRTAEAAVRLSISEARVRQLADAGKLPYVKPTGGRIYIHWPSVLAALEFEASQR